MPTQGSWRPLVRSSISAPLSSMDRRGVRMEEVGLNATRATIGWPVEMPPSVAAGVGWIGTGDRHCRCRISSAFSSPLSAPRVAKPSPISTPFEALIDIIALGDLGVQLPVDRRAPAGRDAGRLNLDDGAGEEPACARFQVGLPGLNQAIRN